MQLLHAMELFVVAHEFSHFVVEERFPTWRGSLDAEQVHPSELFCDELGFSLSRQAQSASENFAAFSGVGAVVLRLRWPLITTSLGLLLAHLATIGSFVILR